MSWRCNLLIVPVLLVGCTGQPDRPALAPDHPANPIAAESPIPATSTTLLVDAPAADGPGNAPHRHGAATTQAIPDALAFVCPMHKEIRTLEPGKCPKCGMKLVKKSTTQPTQPSKGHHP